MVMIAMMRRRMRMLMYDDGCGIFSIIPAATPDTDAGTPTAVFVFGHTKEPIGCPSQ
jgi:hypothetical protein